MKCNKCGSELKEGEKFCQNCGTEISLLTENGTQIALTDVSSHEQNNNINSKNKKTIVIILVSIVLIIIGGLVYYFVVSREEKNNTNINDNKVENNNQIQDNKTTTTTKPITTTTKPQQQVASNTKASSEAEVDHSADSYAEYYYLLERLNSRCGSDDINLFVNGWDSLNDTAMVSIALDSLASDSMTYFDLSKIKGEYPEALDSGYGIKYDSVLEKAKKIFGSNIKILDKKYYRAAWKYVNDLDAYFPIATLNPNSGSGCMPSAYTLVISSVVENGNYLIINVYGTRNKRGANGYIRRDGSTIDISSNEITDYMRQHLDEFNLFELTFIKENNNYIITGIVNKSI